MTEPLTVYLVYGEIAYEEGNLIACFADKEDAKAYAYRQMPSARHYPKGQGYFMGGDQYIVRELRVTPPGKVPYRLDYSEEHQSLKWDGVTELVSPEKTAEETADDL